LLHRPRTTETRVRKLPFFSVPAKAPYRVYKHDQKYLIMMQTGRQSNVAPLWAMQAIGWAFNWAGHPPAKEGDPRFLQDRSWTLHTRWCFVLCQTRALFCAFGIAPASIPMPQHRQATPQQHHLFTTDLPTPEPAAFRRLPRI